MTTRRSHEIKSWPVNFAHAITGRKRFEIRKDDRPYGTGDTVVLYEFDPLPGPDDEPGAMRGYTGRKAFFVIGFVERSAAIPEGWCGFELLSSEELQRTAAAILRSQS